MYLGAYREANILPFDEIRKLAEDKYICRHYSVANHTNTEAELRSDKYFVRAREVCYDCALVLCLVMGYALQFEEIAHKRAHYYYYYYFMTMS